VAAAHAVAVARPARSSSSASTALAPVSVRAEARPFAETAVSNLPDDVLLAIAAADALWRMSVAA
jgi:hypothetical protein